jgi:hypothetical protein
MMDFRQMMDFHQRETRAPRCCGQRSIEAGAAESFTRHFLLKSTRHPFVTQVAKAANIYHISETSHVAIALLELPCALTGA